MRYNMLGYGALMLGLQLSASQPPVDKKAFAAAALKKHESRTAKACNDDGFVHEKLVGSLIYVSYERVGSRIVSTSGQIERIKSVPLFHAKDDDTRIFAAFRLKEEGTAQILVNKDSPTSEQFHININVVTKLTERK